MNQRTICVFVLAAGLSGCPGKDDENGVYTDHRDRAIAANTAAIRLDPTDAEAYRNRGLGYRLKGEHGRALADFTEAIRLGPRYAAAYYARGSTYHTMGEHDKAIADYTETIRLDPKSEIHSADAHTFRGVIYCEMGDLDKGITDYNEAIRLDPEYAEAYHYRGLAFEKSGEPAKAEADFAKARELGYEPE